MALLADLRARWAEQPAQNAEPVAQAVDNYDGLINAVLDPPLHGVGLGEHAPADGRIPAGVVFGGDLPEYQQAVEQFNVNNALGAQMQGVQFGRNPWVQDNLNNQANIWNPVPVFNDPPRPLEHEPWRFNMEHAVYPPADWKVELSPASIDKIANRVIELIEERNEE